MCQSPYSPLRKKIPTRHCPHCQVSMRYVGKLDGMPSDLSTGNVRSWAWSRYRYYCPGCRSFTEVIVETGEVIGNGVPLRIRKRRPARRVAESRGCALRN